ncbi:MAG: DNA-binding response regulator [Rhodobacteraceae bacterium]|nr:DNA-binding response regulator [Paracoccaceae bacterium]
MSQPLVTILDDEPEIRRILADTLEEAGYRTMGFSRATEFEAALKCNTPDVCLVDLGLPDRDADFDRYSLIDSQGEETPFSHAEGEVLRLFLESPKRLISRAFMQERLGGAAGESFDRAMDVRISRLRTKLKEDPKNPQLIKTIYGAGYIFLGDVSWDR